MYDKILRLETGYAQMRKKNAWFGKSLPAIAAALLPVVAAATPLPPFEDSALAPDLRKRLAEEVPGILAERRAALSNVAARVSRAFAGREDAFQRERLDKRLGIALRLCDFAESQHALGDVSGLAFAQRALDDLQEFGTYFRDELELWKDYPRADAPAKPVVLSLADFTGGGVTRRFAKACAAVRALDGKPCILKIPAGEYVFDERLEMPPFVCRHSGQRCADGNIRSAQVPIYNLRNCVIEGEGPERTRFVFGVFESQGVRMVNCRNVTLRNVSCRYAKTPFVQGTITDVDAKAGTCVIAHDAGTLRPDDPSFDALPANMCASQFSPDGRLDRPASFMFVSRGCDDLGNGRFRIRFQVDRPGSQHGKLKAGMKLVIPSRNNFHHAVSAAYSEFCNFENVHVFNSRSGAFSTHASRQTSFVGCRLEPADGMMLSANADGLINAPGTYMSRCTFRNQSDDGFNSMGRGEFVNAVQDGAILHTGVGRGREGELLVIFDPVRGVYRGNFHVKGKPGIVRWRDGGCMRTELAERIPSTVCSYDALGLSKFSREEMGRAAMNLTRLAVQPDHVYAPNKDGIGSVVTGCSISNMRGCGIVLQGANMLVEDTTISNVWMAIRLGALVKYKEGPPPYNVLVRGNRIDDVDFGIVSNVQVSDLGSARAAPIRGCGFHGNSVSNARSAAFKMANLGYSAFSGNKTSGKGGSVSFSRCEHVDDR